MTRILQSLIYSLILRFSLERLITRMPAMLTRTVVEAALIIAVVAIVVVVASTVGTAATVRTALR